MRNQQLEINLHITNQGVFFPPKEKFLSLSKPNFTQTSTN